MNSKVALVTGGTDGVGLSVVKALIKHQFDVYFIAANAAKGKKVEDALKSDAGFSHKNAIQFIQLDLSNLNAVKQFADDFVKTASRLDVLLFSAGVLLPKRQETPEGVEKTLAIGYLSAYILSQALVPLLEKGERARILTISGGEGIVLKESLDFDDFNNARRYSGIRASIRTVHAKVVLTQILAEKLAAKGIDANTVHPGLIKSSLGRSFGKPWRWLYQLVTVFMCNESKSGIHASVSDSLDGVSNQYLSSRKKKPLTYSDRYRKRLIESTESLLAAVALHP